jgi:hypothetical protein
MSWEMKKPWGCRTQGLNSRGERREDRNGLYSVCLLSTSPFFLAADSGLSKGKYNPSGPKSQVAHFGRELTGS